MKTAKRFVITGIVQGVGFRYFALKTANSIGVCGYVKNLYDGSVEVYAAGSPEQLDRLKHKLAAGPSYSHVDQVSEEDTEVIDDCRSFNIKD